MNVLQSLFRSRKFWLAVVGVIVASLNEVIGHDVIQAVEVFLLALIGTIALEDAAGKLNS